MPARRAAEALAAIGTPAAVDALIEPLGHDQTETARHVALIGLSLTGRPAIEPLATALDSSDPILRANAATGAGLAHASGRDRCADRGAR